MKPLRLSLAIIFAAGFSANAQTTATTDPVGFAQVSAPSGSSLIVPGFVNAASFQGQSTVTVSGSSATFSGSFTPGTMGPTTGDLPYPTTYVQVTSGTYSGHVFDIDSVNAGGAIVASDVPSALNGQTVSIVVRPHITLAALFQGATGVSDYSDAVTIANSDGSPTIRYYDGTQWVAADFSTPAGQTVIYPGQGFVFSASQTVSLTSIGSVQTVNTAVPLYAGVANMVGSQNPGASVKIQDLGLATTLVAYTDAINTFETDGNFGTGSVYYSDGTDMLDGSFSPLPPNSPDSVPANSGFAASVSSDTTWISPKPTIAP